LKPTVLIMSSVHSPDDIRIYKKEARSLAAAGYPVSFVVPRRDDAAALDGIEPIWLQRPRGRLQRMTRTAFAVFQTALQSPARICHFHDPELMPWAVLLKLCGKKIIYDVHEDLPRQILSKHYIARPLRRAIALAVGVLERACSRCFDALIAATPPIAEHLASPKTVLVQNFPLIDELFADDFPAYRDREPTFAYVGGISKIRGARELVQAIGLVPSELQATLQVAGKFDPASLEAELKTTPGWNAVRHLGWLSRRETAALMGRCRAGLVTFLPEPNHITAQPNKLFEYMSAGLPVIASNFPLWRQIIDRVRCGLTVDPQQPREIARAMEYILRNPHEAEAMGARGRAAVEQEFRWDKEAVKLVALYDQLSAPSG